jgi:hypothetical protein
MVPQWLWKCQQQAVLLRTRLPVHDRVDLGQERRLKVSSGQVRHKLPVRRHGPILSARRATLASMTAAEVEQPPQY